MLTRSLLGLCAFLLVLALGALVPVAQASHSQPEPDISKLDYAPEGHFKAGALIPNADQCNSDSQPTFRPLLQGRRFNPSGKYNAFDTNVFETFCLPYRGAGDKKADDPYGNGTTPAPEPRHGFCSRKGTLFPGPDAPLSAFAGICPNHQLEYLDYYEETMQDILGEFGVALHRYPFMNPGSGNTEAGTAFNPAAVVPGADHPEDTVIVGAHFDQTTEGPASTWDSAEGHAQVIRVAKIMADYWRATGTRPSATVKFIPWDGEESGTLGSEDYTNNNIVPGQESNVRGYFNTDPCAGGYPAFRNGQTNQRIALGIQVARPEEIPGQFADGRAEVFNEAAPKIVEDVFDKIDDTVPTTGGPREVFISKAEAAAESKQADTRPGGPVAISGARPVLFSSDWANFLDKGVPFFNPGPEVTGPSDESDPNNPDGLAILHTPNDNVVTLNRMTGPDSTGTTWSAGWMKGMEMCSNLLAWGMLRSDQGGAQTTNNDVVAYYEALPNEARAGQPVVFDAAGSYQYAAGRAQVPADQLEYSWEFGDNATGTGQKLEHAYAKPGIYPSKLTVRNKVTGQSDTMAIPITVLGVNVPGPNLKELPAEDADGNYDLAWEFDEAAREGDVFSRYVVEEAPDFRAALEDDGEDIALRWAPSKPTEPSIQPWQHSDRAAGSVRGNIRNSGARSFYTGINRADQKPGVGPDSGVSKLLLKEGVELAQDAELTYRSSYANDRNDVSRVEVAVDDGSGNLEFDTVDEVITTNFFNVPTDEALYPRGMELRRVDLGAYSGKRVRIQFVYALGTSQFVNVLRTGWYVDDVRIDTGTFRPIGEPTAKTLAVLGRTGGTYAYRVRGIYAGGLVTRNSNIRSLRVTTPVDPGPGGTTIGGTTGAGTTGGGTTGGGTTGGPRGGPAGLDTRPASRRFLISRRVVRLRRGSARVVVSCRQSTPCRGTMRLRASVRSGRGARLRRVIVGRRSFTVPARRRTALRVKINRTGRRYAARERRGLRLLVVANVRPPAGVATSARRDTVTASFRLVRARARPRR